MDAAMVICILLYLIHLLKTVRNLIRNLKELKLIRMYKGCTKAKIISAIDGSYRYHLFTKVGCYRPVYQYDVNGIVYEKESPWWYYTDQNIEGNIVTLHYDESNPEKFVAGDIVECKDNVRRSIIWFVFFVLFSIWIFNILR